MSLYMKIVVHKSQPILPPVYLDIAIPYELMEGIRAGDIIGCEFLFYEKTGDNKLATPVLNDFQKERYK